MHWAAPSRGWSRSWPRPSCRAEFANDLSLAADGSWLAVGAEQSVFLYERVGEGFVYRRTLMPPDLDAGQFGETVALSA